MADAPVRLVAQQAARALRGNRRRLLQRQFGLAAGKLLLDNVPEPRPVAPPDDSAKAPIRLGLVIMLLFFGGLGGWAAYAPLNSAVVAPAVVKVEGNRKTIQHLDGGIVKQLRVKEGGRVEAGQTVIVLDDTQIDHVRAEKQKAKEKSGDFTDADEDEEEEDED